MNMTDEEGQWPKWVTKDAIGVGVIDLCAAVTVATGGSGAGVAGFIAAGALKGTAIGAATGAAIGAGTGAVGHRLSTGGTSRTRRWRLWLHVGSDNWRRNWSCEW